MDIPTPKIPSTEILDVDLINLVAEFDAFLMQISPILMGLIHTSTVQHEILIKK